MKQTWSKLGRSFVTSSACFSISIFLLQIGDHYVNFHNLNCQFLNCQFFKWSIVELSIFELYNFKLSIFELSILNNNKLGPSSSKTLFLSSFLLQTTEVCGSLPIHYCAITLHYISHKIPIHPISVQLFCASILGLCNELENKLKLMFIILNPASQIDR